MANTYTSVEQLNVDLFLYVALRTNEALNLGHFPSLSSARWVWIVENFNKLKLRFTTSAAGNATILSNLSSLQNDVTTYKLGSTKVNPFDSLSKFTQYNEFLSLIPLSSLTPSKQESDLINATLAPIKLLSAQDFEHMVTFLRGICSDSFAKIGLGDADVAALKKTPLLPTQRSYTVQDLDQINDLLELADFIEGIVFELKQRFGVQPNLLTFANSNIDPASNLSVDSAYKSYISVPFQQSLEFMAKYYLGAVDNWFELVTVNNLQSPYIDEFGQKVLLLSSGSVNAIRIPNGLQTSLSVGTSIKIGSVTQREEFRTIEVLNDNKDGSLTLFLSGAQDLSRFTSNDNSYVRIFTPNTVNSNSFVLIPYHVSAPSKNRPAPSKAELQALDTALLHFGVDVKRDPMSNDFVIGTDGDFALSYGLSNVRQAVWFLLRTIKGELPFHPNYGVKDSIGDVYLGTTSEQQVIVDLIRKSILSDPRFTVVHVTDLSSTPVSISISLSVAIQGLGVLLPLSFVF